MAEDGPRAWLVCGIVFFMLALSLGFTCSVGIYYLEFLEVFGASKSRTAFITALHFGCTYESGSVASLLIHRWGCRVTMFTGGLLNAAGLMISAFTSSIWTLTFSFGVLTGFGIGFVYTSSIISVSRNFNKYRPLALGISSCGLPVGQLSLPWITNSLIFTFGWRGALIITSGLMLQVCVGAMLVQNPLDLNKNPKSKMKVRLTKDEDENSHEWEKKQSLSVLKHDSINDPSAYEVDAVDKTAKSQTIWNMTKELMKNTPYILLTINNAMFCFGQAVFYTHINAFAALHGAGVSTRNLISTILGISSLLGRAVLSGAMQLHLVNTVVLYICLVFFCGVAVVCYAIWTSVPGLVITAGLFGFFGVSFGPVNVECYNLIMGPKLLNIGIGYAQFVFGFGGIIGAPVAGYLYDATNHYPNTFYLGGGIIMVGSLFLVPVVTCCRSNLRKSAKSNLTQSEA